MATKRTDDPVTEAARTLGWRRQAAMNKAESSAFHSRIAKQRWAAVRAEKQERSKG